MIKAAREIIELCTKIKTQREFNRLKIIIAKKYGLKKILTNIEIANYATSEERKQLHSLLTIKPVRTLSGVAPIAVMTIPHKCPHGKCIYCPGGLNSEFGDVPQSYTGKEPATRRAIRNNYDPYLQVFNRLEQYVVMNKVPDKAEIIIMGGTFLSLPTKYKNKFVMYLYKAMNDFSKIFYEKNILNLEKFHAFFETRGNLNDPERIKRIHKRILSYKKISTLEKEKIENEKAKIRCVGLVIETRPDCCSEKHISQMLKLGCTKVELGVQTIYDDILRKIERGHTVAETIKATKLLKDSGFKVNYHIMPGLVSKKKDIEAFKEIFKNQNFRPDMLKIYPCMVMKGTKLYYLHKQGKFNPLTTEKAASLIIEFKKIVPKYVRIMRVQRDIPTYATFAGVDKTNLRQYIEEIMKKKKIRCHCIRCREIGRCPAKGKIKFKEFHYNASDGVEFFISAEINDSLLGFCRLRFPRNNTALIRELHVLGEAVSIGMKGDVQHKGIGRKLMEIAEKVAKTYCKYKIVVISGIGAREYYRKLGYRKEGPYMTKLV